MHMHSEFIVLLLILAVASLYQPAVAQPNRCHSSRNRVVVIGAGLSGLGAAHALQVNDALRIMPGLLVFLITSHLFRLSTLYRLQAAMLLFWRHAIE